VAQPGIAPTPGGSPWGRPARLERGRGIIDLRTRDAGFGPGGSTDTAFPCVGNPERSPVAGPFRFVPPPPAPPGQDRGQKGGRIARFGLRTVGGRWLELAVALLALAVVALVTRPCPSPTNSSKAWETKASPAVAALAEDLAAAGRQPTIDATTSARLERDVAGLEAAGPPPADTAAAWNRVLGRVRLAVGEVASDPGATRSDLQLAELEVLELSGPGAAGAATTGRR
jgi:hypothetical protein